MATFLLQNSHDPEDCEHVVREWRQARAEALRGRAFFWTCPAGVHGGYGIVEAVDPDELLASLPPRLRAGCRVHAGSLLTAT